MLLTTYCNAHSSSTHPVLHSLLACLAPEQPVFCTACRLSLCCSVFPFLNLFSLVVFVRLFVPDIGYLCFPLSFLLALLFYDGIYLDIDYPCKISRSLCFHTPLRSFFYHFSQTHFHLIHPLPPWGHLSFTFHLLPMDYWDSFVLSFFFRILECFLFSFALLKHNSISFIISIMFPS